MRPRQLAAAIAFAAALLAAGRVPSQITIGPGPALGTTAGETWFEEMQDWTLDDCVQLDEANDVYAFNDGFDGSRDLIAFYHRDDPAAGAAYFRADFLELSFGAENASLDLYVMIDFGTPGAGQEFLPDFVDCRTDSRWEVAIALYGASFWTVYDQQFTILSSQAANASRFLGAYYRSDLDAVEFGIERSLLSEQGWDGASPLRFQVFTTKDGTLNGPGEVPGTSDLADAFVDDDRGFSDPDGEGVGTLNGAFASSDSVRGARFAYILHGNQAISQADAIQALIHNATIQTPAGNPTGYVRALETAEIFNAPPNIHVSGTLVAGALWADLPGDAEPADGPLFVERIKRLVDGTPDVRGAGALVGGVYSEHIMPYFEGTANRDSTALNERVLEAVFDVAQPTANSVFWVPERVIEGSTFADIAGAGYGWTVLDQVNHLRTWFGDAAATSSGHKVQRINGVNCFMINDEPDRFKFANSDGGLWFDTRTLLLDLALGADGEQLLLVFDDWEAYAGRSFTDFDQGTDNPDNWNRNVRWIANHPWIRVSTLEEIAALGWTPVDRGDNPALPIETYDFLDHATEGSYDNWYFGSALEEDFDDFFPRIRGDLSVIGSKKFGHQDAPGTIAGDLRASVFALPAGTLSDLARFGFATGIFETAWHDEDFAVRCPDGTYCNPDTTFDGTANFAKRLQYGAFRQTGVSVRAAQWAATAPAAGGMGPTTRTFEDIDHDGEMEAILFNDLLFAAFENDGGRLVALYARRLGDNYATQVVGNLLGFPDQGDERENDAPGRFRTSALVDFSVGAGSFTNRNYLIETIPQGLRLFSDNNQATKEITLAPGAAALEVRYLLSAGAPATIRVRHGLVPDLLALLTTPRHMAVEESSATSYALRHGATGIAVGIDFGSGAHNAVFLADGENVGANGARNQAMIHVAETTCANGTRFSIFVDGLTPSSIQTSGALLR